MTRPLCAYYAEQCNVRVGGNVVASFWRERPDGTRYRVFVRKGDERCPNEAVYVRHKNGRAIRRCRVHPFKKEATTA